MTDWCLKLDDIPGSRFHFFRSMLLHLKRGFDSLASTTDVITANAARERGEKEALARAQNVRHHLLYST